MHVVRAGAVEIVQRTPPREMQLWNAGENPTDYGVHRWTPRSAEEVGSRYAERGNWIQLDIEHNCSDESESDPAAVPPTAGYARLEIRAGVPFLVFEDEAGRSTWSAVGAEQITTGQRLYLSPEYGVDTATGEIVYLTRVSLVAKPGTHGARVLATGGADRMSTMGRILNYIAAAKEGSPSKMEAALAGEIQRLGAGPAARAIFQKLGTARATDLVGALVGESGGNSDGPPADEAPEAEKHAARAIPGYGSAENVAARAQLREQMGLTSSGSPIRHTATSLVLGTFSSAEQAREHCRARGIR